MNALNLTGFSHFCVAMDYQRVLVWSIAFLQWISLPLAILGVQNLTKNLIGRNNIIINVALAILTLSFIILAPLELLGILPLNSLFNDYKYAGAIGGLLSIPLTRFARTWGVTRDYFR